MLWQSFLSCPNISAHEKAWGACYWTISWCISKTKVKKIYPNQKPHCKICGSRRAQEVSSHISTLLPKRQEEYRLASSRPRTGRLGSGFYPHYALSNAMVYAIHRSSVHWWWYWNAMFFSNFTKATFVHLFPLKKVTLLNHDDFVASYWFLQHLLGSF